MLCKNEEKRINALRRYNILDTAPETEFDNIIRLVQSTFKVPMAAISFIDTDRQWFKAAYGLDISETPRDIAFCDHTIRDESVMIVPDAKSDRRFDSNPFVTSDPGIMCYMGAPLKTPDGQNIGSLCVIGTEPRDFSAAEAEILEGFATLVVSQLELRQTANLDTLTHVMSRGAFLDQVDAAVKAYKSQAIGATLAILDIDKFKELNDRYGHPVGDKILQEFVNSCLASLRSEDLVGRLGGDEFAILLRGVTPTIAASILSRVHENLSEIKLQSHPEIKVSASIGHCAISDDIEDRNTWLQKADEALYNAKNAGRSRVVAA